jgi:hypothetical protein
MPVADGEAEVVLHPLSKNGAILVVIPEGKGILALDPLELHRVGQGKEAVGSHDLKLSSRELVGVRDGVISDQLGAALAASSGRIAG